jgi:hypothetical protein
MTHLHVYTVVVGIDKDGDAINLSITRVNKVLVDHNANSIDEAIMVIGSMIRQDLEGG